MKKYFTKSAKTSLVLVYLVIIAGALVRMTGSGMGCPDWPKCFGYYIPPTQEKELLFAVGKEYNKGQVIIKDKTLLVAKKDFIASKNFEIINWEKYTKHDYAVFNPFHTWVEYINRLFGALAGIACFITFIISFWFWKENKKLLILAFLICVLMGFQAWLGKTVVDSVLNPFKITTHMLVALIIVAFQLILIYSARKIKKIMIYDNKFNLILIFALIFTIIQIILGTTVREYVDTISETGLPKILWLQNPSVSFYIHRSFSIVVFLTIIYLYLRNRKLNLGFNKMNWVLILLILEIISGISMYYLDFPFGTQTIHIVIATLLFGFQFYMILESKSKKTQL
ncbi:heme A synthase [Flavobacterium sp.]|uniref:COX15/CtaA family protein n=1 Tax=Flavobacterium sp. TaxID=239 RepID=UPI003751D58C